MMRCGGGHKHLEKFCGIMNMSPLMTQKNYDSLSEKLNNTTKMVAKTSMIQAAVVLKKIECCDVGASFDGLWQCRGSCNGIGRAISITTGKVFDCEILS